MKKTNVRFAAAIWSMNQPSMRKKNILSEIVTISLTYSKTVGFRSVVFSSASSSSSWQDLLLILAVFLALVSLSASVFQRRLSNKLKKIFSEDHIPLEIGFEKYILGAVALVIFLFI